MLKRFLNEYLNFTKKERAGTIMLLILIMIFSILPFFYSFFIHPKTTDHTVFEKDIAALQWKQSDSEIADRNEYTNHLNYSPAKDEEKAAKPALFYFDPNTISAEGWQKLGVREKTITTIEKFKSKGGRFYKPEDISKIWGLRENEVKALLPFVRIATIAKPVFDDQHPSPVDVKKEFTKPAIQTLDINTADTAAFIALPWIGSKLANRIVTFREKLGGFHSVDQIKEVYGLQDSVFQKIKSRLIVNQSNIQQININTATIDEMKAHPYIRYYIANAIVQYRSQHGNFTSVADLKKIMLITDEVYNKAVPYLKVN